MNDEQVEQLEQVKQVENSIACYSIFKQRFCHFKNRHTPEDFADEKYPNLDDILEGTKIKLRKKCGKDDKFALILYTYLIYPAYFSKSDYLTLIDSFSKLDMDTQLKMGIHWCYPMIHYACINSAKFPLGIYNFINLWENLPYLRRENVLDKKGININKIMEEYYVNNETNIFGLGYTIKEWVSDILFNAEQTELWEIEEVYDDGIDVIVI